jgi:lipid II:glycine glycyltransferase (peptidoglycan interpeptide bridge formation enzyme)
MNDSGLELTKCVDLFVWDNFVASSPQNNVFCRTHFLQTLGIKSDLWVVKRKGDTLAGAIIFRSGPEVLLAPRAFTIYQGVLLGHEILGMAPHRKSAWSLEVVGFLLQGLSSVYDRLSFCLHHSFDDLRSFQWFHYHEPELGLFNIDLNYTGLLNLAEYRDFETYLSGIRPTRRYEYRRALKIGLSVEKSQDVDILCDLHDRTFERQGIGLQLKEKQLVRSITTAAITHGFGQMLLCRDKNGEYVSATLFIFDERCAYYLFGANSPEHRNLNGGTFLMLENIRRCMDRELKSVDMVGVNSPNRGDFKTSFNSEITPYFIATWDKPHGNL